MTEDEVKKFIESNKHRLPLSYNEVVYKRDSDEPQSQSKIIKSKYYKDSNYNVSKPVKKISRLL